MYYWPFKAQAALAKRSAHALFIQTERERVSE